MFDFPWLSCPIEAGERFARLRREIGVHLAESGGLPEEGVPDRRVHGSDAGQDLEPDEVAPRIGGQVGGVHPVLEEVPALQIIEHLLARRREEWTDDIQPM